MIAFGFLLCRVMKHTPCTYVKLHLLPLPSSLMCTVQCVGRTILTGDLLQVRLYLQETYYRSDYTYRRPTTGLTILTGDLLQVRLYLQETYYRSSYTYRRPTTGLTILTGDLLQV